MDMPPPARRFARLRRAFAARLPGGLRVRLFLVFYLVTLGTVGALGYFGYEQASRAYRSKATELVGGYTAETASKMDIFQETMLTNLHFLAANPALAEFAHAEARGDLAAAQRGRAQAETLFLLLARAGEYYHKISFIDAHGRERIGVKRAAPGASPYELTEAEQESISENEFFQRSMRLHAGETYASRLEPYVERGRIVKPVIPVVRFATPVIDARGQRLGLIVVQVLGEGYFKFARAANAIHPDLRFYLFNDRGEYLYHPEPDRTFGTLLGHEHNFDRDYPDLLEFVRAFEFLHTVNVHGQVMAFRHIHPNAGRHENGFILVGMVDEAAALAEGREFIYKFVALLMIVTAVVLFVSHRFVTALMRPLQAVTAQLQALSRGETGGARIDYAGDDEIGRMVASSQLLMENMERLAHQADIVSRGDFSGEVPLLSEHDRLGLAINNMMRMLRKVRTEEQRDNWIKDGIGRLSQALTGDLDPITLAELAIREIGRHLEAGRAVLYRWETESETLVLVASYMFTEREALGNRFRLGEGAVGQVAREKKPIVLHAEANAPLDAAPIVTGTTRRLPGHTYTWPVLHEGELLGVIEVARFTPLDEAALDYLGRASNTIASFLYTAAQRERIRALLLASETAARQVQEQNLRLQEANSQLEEQQQQLQQQAAELQASNAQMEEQQQQLQQQAAELKAANARMEMQQNELERRNRELSASQAELDARARQLELANRYKSQFLANMSHELRTPLNSIILLAKLMARNEEGHLSEEEVRRAEIIHRAGEELLRLINDVLDLSKIEAGRMQINPATVESAELAEAMRDWFAEAARDKGLEFTVEDGIADRLLIDRDKVAQILRNLTANALKFTPKGHVRLRFERRAGEPLPLAFHVEDTGIGVPEDKRALIFEAFQQADGSTSREYGGTGLGLSISRSLAHLMGGEIELSSTPGTGSTFTLRLPETPPPPIPAAKALSPLPCPPQTSVPLTPAPAQDAPPWPEDDRERIGEGDSVLLLIDDDPVFARVILDINRRLGYRTLLAGRGDEGLALARRFQPDGILLDLGLPDLDGRAVLHQLKTTPELAAIPVYVISARDRDDALLAQGALGYLRKPADDTRLAAAEAEILERAPAARGADILLIENGLLDTAALRPILGPHARRLIALDSAAAQGEALDAALAKAPRLAILDLGRGSIDAALAVAERLTALQPNLPLLFYGGTTLSEEDEARLRHYSDSIILEAPQAAGRLRENIERFFARARQRAHVERASTPGAQDQRLRGRHILVVDDDARNLFVLTAVLEQHGATVDNALNGRRALEKMTERTPDLVLLDIMMPEMDGYKTVQAMRTDPRLAAVPVLALTAKALPSDREAALAAGCNDYLAKPADDEMLINRIAAWCQSPRPRP